MVSSTSMKVGTTTASATIQGLKAAAPDCPARLNGGYGRAGAHGVAGLGLVDESGWI